MGSVSEDLTAYFLAGGNGELLGSSIQFYSGSFLASSSNTGGGHFGNKSGSGFENLGQTAGSERMFVGRGTSIVVGGSWVPLLSNQPRIC